MITNLLTNITYNNHNDYSCNQRPNYSAISFCGGADVFVKAADSVIPQFDKSASEKLLSIFDRKLNKMPKGLNITLSQANDSVVSFSKDLGNNRIVKAIKKVAVERHKQFLYVVYNEYKNGILKSSFAVDIQTGGLVKLNGEGKARIVKDDFVRYSETCNEHKYKQYCEKLKEYADAILDTNGSEKKGKVKRANKINPNGHTKLIDRDLYDDLPPKSRKAVAEINSTLIGLSELIEARRGKSAQIVNAKMAYEPIIYEGCKKKNTVFKYKNTETLSVLHIKSNQRFTRIVHTNSNGIETHYLIDSERKVVSNLNKKRPQLIPGKYRYMNKRELEECGIEKYIEFLNNAVKEYYEYINKAVEGKEVVHRKRAAKSKNKFDQFLEDVNSKISNDLQRMSDEIGKRANDDANEFVSEYFRQLQESFDLYSKEQLPAFMRKLRNYIEKMTATKESA